MTKILPTKDDYQAEIVTEFLENPDISLEEKAALLEDPSIQEVAAHLDSEVRIDGTVPHMMERWQEMLENERNGHPSQQKTPDLKKTLKQAGDISLDRTIGALFHENEVDEGVVKETKLVLMPHKPSYGKTA